MDGGARRQSKQERSRMRSDERLRGILSGRLPRYAVAEPGKKNIGPAGAGPMNDSTIRILRAYLL